MTRILRALLMVCLTMLLVGALAHVQVHAQGKRLPQAAPEVSEDTPAEEDEAQPDQEDEAEPDADEEPTPAPPQRRAVPPQRAQPAAPQRAQPSTPASKAQPQVPARARVQPAPAKKQAEEADELPALDELTVTRERPLFSSTRRPPEVEPDEEPSEPIADAKSMPFELVGIVLGDDINAAIFRNTESKEETRVIKGDKIGNWSVEEIVDRAVVLRGSGKRVRMRMFDEASAPGIQVGRVSGEDAPAAETPAESEDDNSVDEDIAPSASPQVRPATAQPKPPPSLQNKERQRRAGRQGRPNPRARQQRRQEP